MIYINNPQKEEIAYGIVDLASNNTNCIPLAFAFDSTIKEKLGEIVEVTIDPKAKNIKKPYRAFIFSMKTNDFKSYKVDIYIYGNNNEILISLIISLAFILALLIAIIIKKCIGRNQYFDSDDSLI